jgi:hypothetical protein
MLSCQETHAIVRPSGDNTVTTRIEFNVGAFLKDQAARAELARRGAVVPVLSGRQFRIARGFCILAERGIRHE